MHSPKQFLFSRAQYNFPRRKIVSYGEGHTVGIDLIDMSKDRYPGYILMVVDYFTRKLYARKMKTKTEAEITENLLTIGHNIKFKAVHSDQESGLIHNKFLKMHNIPVFQTNIHGSPIVERCIRTIKNEMEARRRASNLKDWKPKLQAVVDWYNDKVHSVLNMSPNEAQKNPDDTYRIQQEIAQTKVTATKNLLSAGDKVVLQRKKEIFAKESKTPKWGSTVHTVTGWTATQPRMYILDDDDTHKYYRQQLLKLSIEQLKALQT